MTNVKALKPVENKDHKSVEETVQQVVDHVKENDCGSIAVLIIDKDGTINNFQAYRNRVELVGSLEYLKNRTISHDD